MLVKCGIHILLVISLAWNLYSVVLLGGHVEASGILFLGNGASHLMLVLNHYAGQIFLFIVTTCVSTLYDILNSRTSINFYNYYHCNTSYTRSHKLSVVPLPSSVNSHRYSFFVNTAFLWNTVSFDILSIKSVNSFRRAIYRLFCT